jgi:hypothetical protein
MKPWLLPSGLQRGISFIIPDNWSPEQALAVIELLDDLREIIVVHYQIQVYELLKEQRFSRVDSASGINETDPPF